MYRSTILAAFVFVAGCAPAMTFNSDSAEKTAARSRSASRLPRAEAGCESIGTLTFERSHPIVDSDIESIAAEVAAAGGTHYVVRNRTSMTRAGRVRPSYPVVDVLVCSYAIAHAGNRARY